MVAEPSGEPGKPQKRTRDEGRHAHVGAWWGRSTGEEGVVKTGGEMRAEEDGLGWQGLLGQP